MQGRSALLGAALGCAAFVPVILSACGSAHEGDSLRPADEPRDEVAQSAGEAAQAAPEAAAPEARPSRRMLRGMARYHGGGVQQSAQPICNSPQLQYFGGPVLQSPTVVAVFWGPSVNAQTKASMAQFYADAMASSYWPWLHEYDPVAQPGGTAQVILPGTAPAGVTIAPLKCNPGTTGCKLTDTDLQTELNRQISMGVLPAPTLDCTGNTNTIYMIHFAPNVSLAGPGGIRGCAAGGFCGYHSTGMISSGTNSGKPLIYAALMDTFSGGCASGCGANATALQNQTSIASHELVEATTDPDVGLIPLTAPGYQAPAGWGDNNNQCGEIGDICDDNTPGDTITVGGRSWIVQPEWSNANNACVSSAPMPAVCTGSQTTGCRVCGCGDNGVDCPSGQTCGGGGNAVACGGATCVPKKTCPTGQNCGTASDGCGGMINCGTCTAPQTCGGGGVANVCGGGGVANVCGSPCVPAKTCPGSYQCGTAPDGCGGTITCGTCTPPQTCGGGANGNPNLCGGGCVPLKTCPAGDNCGSVPDGCGGMLSCGTCAANQICTNNVCTTLTTSTSSSTGSSSSGTTSTSSSSSSTGSTSTSSSTGTGCVPTSCQALGATCGPVGDGCGNTLQCGTCTAPQTCGGGGTPNVCGGSSGNGNGGGSSTSTGTGGTTEGGPGKTGGCGCKTAGDPAGTPASSLSALGLLALAGFARARRRRAA